MVVQGALALDDELSKLSRAGRGAELLGHSSTAITLDLYSHVTARLVVSATDVMGALSPPIAAPPAAPMPPENADNPGGAGIVAAPPDDRIT